MSNSLTRETAPRESQELTHARPALIAQHFLHRRATPQPSRLCQDNPPPPRTSGHRTGYRFTMYATGPGITGSTQGPPPKLKPRWDVHLSGDDDQLGCAGKSLSSVLGERSGTVV